MFNTTVAAYLLPLFVIGFIVPFLLFTLSAEFLYDFSQQKCWWEISPKSLLYCIVKKEGSMKLANSYLGVSFYFDLFDTITIIIVIIITCIIIINIIFNKLTSFIKMFVACNRLQWRFLYSWEYGFFLKNIALFP